MCRAYHRPGGDPEERNNMNLDIYPGLKMLNDELEKAKDDGLFYMGYVRQENGTVMIFRDASARGVYKRMRSLINYDISAGGCWKLIAGKPFNDFDLIFTMWHRTPNSIGLVRSSGNYDHAWINHGGVYAG